MTLAMNRRDLVRVALEAAARLAPPGSPAGLPGTDAGLMARAVAPPGGGVAATASADTSASGLGLAPVAGDRDAADALAVQALDGRQGQDGLDRPVARPAPRPTPRQRAKLFDAEQQAKDAKAKEENPGAWLYHQYRQDKLREARAKLSETRIKALARALVPVARPPRPRSTTPAPDAGRTLRAIRVNSLS